MIRYSIYFTIGKLEGKEVTRFLDSVSVAADSSTRRALMKKFQGVHKLSFREFVDVMKTVQKKKHDKKHELASAFAKFDKDNSHTIEGAELKALLKHLVETTQFKSRREILARFDANHDGKLSFKEFVKIMQAAEDDAKAEKTALRAFAKYDRDHSGLIEPKEFRAFLESLRLATSGEQRIALQKALGDRHGAFDQATFVKVYLTTVRSARKRDEEVKKAFKAADRDHSGELSRKEVASILPKLGLDLTSDELKRKFSSADESGDGQLNFKEFRELLFILQDTY
jgi:Ca2+-binding EF-hand superfamily protein